MAVTVKSIVFWAVIWWMFINVSEEHAASVFRVKESAELRKECYGYRESET
jgi:hypothetical protein